MIFLPFVYLISCLVIVADAQLQWDSFSNRGLKLEPTHPSQTIKHKLGDGTKRTRHEKAQVPHEFVSHTDEAAALRSYRLRDVKRTGFFWPQEVTTTDLLFPGMQAEQYQRSERIIAFTDVVQSRSQQSYVGYRYYDLPVCPKPPPHSYLFFFTGSMVLIDPITWLRDFRDAILNQLPMSFKSKRI